MKNIPVEQTLLRLRQRFAAHGGLLEIGTPYHILTLVMMSARTRDAQVLKLAPRFFAAFPTVNALAEATGEDIARTINTIGMYKQKARNLHAMARKVVESSSGQVPATMEALTALPGVGRKTASVVLVAAFGKRAIAVDTHVFRVVQRLGWTRAKTPVALERKLLRIVPSRLAADVNHVFVPFGRSVCTPLPRCFACPVADLCAFPKKRLTPPANASEIMKNILAQESLLLRLRDAAVRSIE